MWKLENLDPALPIYRALVEQLASDIEDGVWRDGDKLPPVRELAFQLKLNMGTIYRAYELAQRRGLLVKHVGRGSFVRVPQVAASGSLTGALDAAVREGPVDLRRNVPPFIDTEPILRQTMLEMAQNGASDGAGEGNLADLLDYGPSQGLPRHREILAAWLRQTKVPASAENLIITGGAQQGLTIALGALAPPGGTVMVESHTYPGLKNLARMFGLRLWPVAMDGQGLLPDALARAARESGSKLLYCMPRAQNPTSATMTAGRRAEIAEISRKLGLNLIENDVNAHDPGEDSSPLAALLPEKTVYISSLSKTVAPGLRLGMILAPASILLALLAASQTTSWMAPPLMAELACRWLRNGAAEDLAAQRLRITRRLQKLAARHLGGLDYAAHAANTQIWLPLPAAWDAGDFVRGAAARGVLVTQSDDYAVTPPGPYPAVRLNLNDHDEARLPQALDSIAALAREAPRAMAFNM